MSKIKKPLLTLGAIGATFFLVNTSLNKFDEILARSNINTELETSNIELSLNQKKDSLNQKIIPLNKIVGDDTIKIIFEDYMIDGDNILIGISEIQNLEPSDYKVQSPDDYKEYLTFLKSEFLKNKDNLNKFGQVVDSMKIDIFDGKEIDIEAFNLPEDIDFLEMLLKKLEKAYDWGLSDEGFYTTLEEQMFHVGFEPFATGELSVLVNNQKVELNLFDSPVSLNEDYLDKLNFNVSKTKNTTLKHLNSMKNKTEQNFNIKEYTIGFRIPEEFKKTTDLNISISFNNFRISEYYPVTYDKELKTEFAINTNNLDKNFKVIKLNTDTSLKKDNIEFLEYRETDYTSEFIYEIKGSSIGPELLTYTPLTFSAVTDEYSKDRTVRSIKFNKITAESVDVNLGKSHDDARIINIKLN